MNKTALKHFNNIGYLKHTFKEEELSFLREEVNDIKCDFDGHSNNAINKTLAGNLEYSYELPKSLSKLEKLLFPYLDEFNREFGYMKSITPMTDNVPITLNQAWVNFQKKTEFNPVHNHTGVISFVLYLDVPYYIEDEMQMASSVNSNYNVPGHFSFFYIDSMGEISPEVIPVDKTYRNILLMFPAKMMHCVYPFYTSDEYRISVSGNFSLNTNINR